MFVVLRNNVPTIYSGGSIMRFLKGFKVLCVVLLCMVFALPAFGEKVRLVLVINETQVEGMDARLKK